MTTDLVIGFLAVSAAIGLAGLVVLVVYGLGSLIDR
jgi:hypothetical protein